MYKLCTCRNTDLLNHQVSVMHYSFLTDTPIVQHLDSFSTDLKKLAFRNWNSMQYMYCLLTDKNFTNFHNQVLDTFYFWRFGLLLLQKWKNVKTNKEITHWTVPNRNFVQSNWNGILCTSASKQRKSCQAFVNWTGPLSWEWLHQCGVRPGPYS